MARSRSKFSKSLGIITGVTIRTGVTATGIITGAIIGIADLKFPVGL